MQLTTLVKVLLASSSTVRATIEDGFPFQEQLPTITRVDQAYSFQISNDTFQSTEGDVTYSVDGLPSWLSFDTESRTFQGTPSESDATDSLEFTLLGEDTAGDTISSQCTIVVSEEEGPEPSTDFTVLNQLATFGQTNGADSLVLSPGDVFNITFDRRTFVSNDTVVAYYGRSVERSPLPSWLFFDSTNIRFSGVAPPANSEIAPGFQYSFRLFASDYADYAATYVDFGITVGAHELSTTLKDTININGSSGDTLNYQVPLSSVYQDGVPVSLANISSAVLTNQPSWISLDNYTLVGSVPEDFTSSDVFELVISDKYSNAVSLSFQVESITSLFAVDSFRSVNATRGEYFQFYFLETDFTDYSTTNVSVEITDADWLFYNESNLTISGETPDDFESASVTVIASHQDQEDELTFIIYGVDPIEESSSSSSMSHTSSSSSSSFSSTSSTASTVSSSVVEPTATESTTPLAKSSNSSNKSLAIGLGVAIPLFVLIVAGLLLYFCCFRRRSKGTKDDEEKKSPTISKPILGNPANGNTPNIPPGGYYPSDSSLVDEKNEAVRLGALNALKLDEKDYDSTTSSTTNVEAFDSADETNEDIYHDAMQAQSTDFLMANHNDTSTAAAVAATTVPKKSWRQTVDSNINRESLNSLATVSTNELFSIRLADDDTIPKDPRKSNLNFRDSVFLGSTVSSILSRDDSGNIQRLDSDGNIVEKVKDPRSKSRTSNLDILKEEGTPHPNEYGNLEGDVSFTTANSGSTGEDFYPVTQEDGQVTWKQSPFNFEKGSVKRDPSTSKAKLKDFTNKSRSSQADISNDITVSTGETAEIESV
ncbi:AXL2 [Cyberlindnera jadinii]|uniref:AXL2 protein n=1 Tax=Cyberlindnera jadinii (strain ATCC 18201 / CBS 1600 / BCRC 20928 / JCM 3617 / NBRC 0987 / NRRL Y-1542) TaxID=983966 RepID=A0A0H5BZJ0_CYBJN|nr:AXL2 [Cyberlindnera jadinii]